MDVIMPQLGETVAEGTVTKWYKKVGDTVKADDVLFDVETDKVSTEIPAQANGVIAEILVAEGVTAKVGAKLAVIREATALHQGSGMSQAPAAAPSLNAAVPAATGHRAEARTGTAARSAEMRGAGERLSPVVRRLLAEHKLDPAQIAGTGRDGRITRGDVLAFIAREKVSDTVSVEVSDTAETVPLNNIRRRTAEHVARSWTTVPHVLQVVEADFQRVEQARRAAGDEWRSREGYELTYLPFIARALSAALAKYPRLNAYLERDRLVVHRRINLGIAVDLNFEGLVVPVLKDAAGRSVAQLARAIRDIATRARAGTLRPDDMTEGTYTVSNNGAFGTLITAPIISPPQVAILSTDGIRKRPVVIEGPDGDAIAIRPVGMLAQTFDHRAVDGAYSAAFLRELKTIIETCDWTKELQE